MAKMVIFSSKELETLTMLTSSQQLSGLVSTPSFVFINGLIVGFCYSKKKARNRKKRVVRRTSFPRKVSTSTLGKKDTLTHTNEVKIFQRRPTKERK